MIELARGKLLPINAVNYLLNEIKLYESQQTTEASLKSTKGEPPPEPPVDLPPWCLLVAIETARQAVFWALNEVVVAQTWSLKEK